MAAKLRLVTPADPDEPMDLYLNQVNSGTIDIFPYERLMIWYRKLKLYEQEIKVIEKGIARFKQYYADQQRETTGRKINPSIKALSAKFSKTTGLHDKKGNALYLPEPLPKWIKRKEVAEEKLKKQKSKPLMKRKRK